MRILLVNDDGINAEGIRKMASALSNEHEVYVVAPMQEQSGMSQALTVGKPLHVKNIDLGINGVKAYSVSGTPADCSKLALEFLLDKLPDLVISGINHGSNLGTDVLYSGTVGAALEAYLHKIPAIAISASSKSTISFDEIAGIISREIKYFYDTDKLFMYNINFPNSLKDDKIKFVFTKHGYRTYDNEFDEIILDDGSKAYTMKGRAKDIGNDESTDIEVVKKGFISVTPLHVERTDFSKLNKLSDLGGIDNGIND